MYLYRGIYYMLYAISYVYIYIYTYLPANTFWVGDIFPYRGTYYPVYLYAC